MIPEILVLIGCLLTLVSAIGMIRFDDVFARMHALAKASTLGVILVLIGAAIAMSHPNDVTSLALAAILQLVTSPVAANMVARSTYLAEGIPYNVDTVDDLAAALEHETDTDHTDPPDPAGR